MIFFFGGKKFWDFVFYFVGENGIWWIFIFYRCGKLRVN